MVETHKKIKIPFYRRCPRSLSCLYCRLAQMAQVFMSVELKLKKFFRCISHKGVGLGTINLDIMVRFTNYSLIRKHTILETAGALASTLRNPEANALRLSKLKIGR